MPTRGTATASGRTIGRLSLYRRLLNDLLAERTENVYSHQLATMAGCTAAQVRRDIMVIGYSGSPTRGYDVRQLIDAIGRFLDDDDLEGVALIGVGNLGRALLAYFAGRRPKLAITAGFDADPSKGNRVINGVRCYPMDQLEGILSEQKIRQIIIATPADAAQEVADRAVRAGVRGILNFAPTPLRVREDVYVDNIDMTTSLEKVAYFARSGDAR
ncbi:MAG: redox-sensing transcriptional repressor Rex [Planctomycetota bacterium]